MSSPARAATNPSQFALPDDNVTDGNGVQGTLTIGVSTEDGRGNITAYASYQDNKQILQRDRDFSACSLGANPTVSFACGGSGTSFPGQFTDFGANSNGNDGPDGKAGTADDVPDTNPLPSFNSSLTGNTFRNFATRPTSTTSVRSTTTCVRTRATAWARWVTTSWRRSPTCTRS